MTTCRASTGHCCHLGPFGVCPALRDDGPVSARRWVCTFREQLGSWSAVHADPTYRATIGPIVQDLVGMYCGDWPPPGQTCAECAD